MVLLQLVYRSLGLVSTVILARLLVPEDFGLVAMALVILGALEILGQAGFNLSLIRNQQAGRPQYDTAWTLQVLWGVLTAGVLLLGAPLIAAFFEEARLQGILYVFAVVSFIEGFKNIGIVDFRKELRFGVQAETLEPVGRGRGLRYAGDRVAELLGDPCRQHSGADTGLCLELCDAPLSATAILAGVARNLRILQMDHHHQYPKFPKQPRRHSRPQQARWC